MAGERESEKNTIFSGRKGEGGVVVYLEVESESALFLLKQKHHFSV